MLSAFEFVNAPGWDKIVAERAELMWGVDWREKLPPFPPGKITAAGLTESVRLEGWDLAWSWKDDHTLEIKSRKVGVNALQEQDPAPGIPAVVKYYDNCQVKEVLFYENGYQQNPSAEIPAQICYYKTGKVKSTTRRVATLATDGEFGIPAEVLYDEKGECSGGWSSVSGLLTPPMAIKRIKEGQSTMLRRLCRGTSDVVTLAKSCCSRIGKGEKFPAGRDF